MTEPLGTCPICGEPAHDAACPGRSLPIETPQARARRYAGLIARRPAPPPPQPDDEDRPPWRPWDERHREQPVKAMVRERLAAPRQEDRP